MGALSANDGPVDAHGPRRIQGDFSAPKPRPETVGQVRPAEIPQVARYVLPVATHAHLYHTISGLTLHRYHRLCQSFDTPWEQRIVVDKMIEAVRAVDPLFAERMEDPLPLEKTPEFRADLIF